MYVRPVLRERSTIRLQSAMLVAIGTVQATCLPALRAARDIQAWSGIGELMCTASTFGSRISALKSSYRFSTPKASPMASSLARVRWQMAYILACG